MDSGFLGDSLGLTELLPEMVAQLTQQPHLVDRRAAQRTADGPDRLLVIDRIEVAENGEGTAGRSFPSLVSRPANRGPCRQQLRPDVNKRSANDRAKLVEKVTCPCPAVFKIPRDFIRA